MTNQLFTDLFVEFRHQLTGYAYSIVKTSTDAEDIVSNAFIKLWQEQKFAEDECYGHLRNYLFLVVKNQALSILRRREIRKRIEQIITVSEAEEPVIYDQLHDKKRMARLKECIEQLPPKSKQAFELRYLEELRGKQVSKILNANESTVRTLCAHAMHILKKKLQ